VSKYRSKYRFVQRPVAPAPPPGVQGQIARIACGPSHMVAVLKNGTATAWGYATDLKTTVPTTELRGAKVVAVSAGYRHSLFLTSDGRVFKAGVLPGITTARVPLAEAATAIASGANHGVAILKTSKTVAVFGDVAGGFAKVPAAVNASTPVTIIAAQANCTAALTSKGIVMWGDPAVCDSPVPQGTGYRSLQLLLSVDEEAFFDGDEPRYVYYRVQAQLTNGSWDARTTSLFDAARVAGRGVTGVLPNSGETIIALKSTGPQPQTVLEQHEFRKVPVPSDLVKAAVTPVDFCTTIIGETEGRLAAAVLDDGRVVAWRGFEPDGDPPGVVPVPAAVQGKAASVACSSFNSLTFTLKSSGGGGTSEWDPPRCLLQEDVPADARAPAVVKAVGAGGNHRVYLVRLVNLRCSCS
jgi:hypothetical protein